MDVIRAQSGGGTRGDGIVWSSEGPRGVSTTQFGGGCKDGGQSNAWLGGG